MREIKFRFYNKDKNEMIYSDSDRYEHLSDFFYNFDYFDGNKSELTQYTGLKDSEGNEIYEGDIVRAIGLHEEIISTVIWRKSCFAAGGYILSAYGDDLTVIGNIYQNPELLNEPQNANSGID